MRRDDRSGSDRDDRAELRRIVRELYGSVSAAAGVAPRILDGMAHLHPRARMCRTVRDDQGRREIRIMSRDAYAENVLGLITELGFFEVEVRHQAFVYGHIAHVISHYEAFADEARTRRVKKGVNSIQFLKVDDRWKVYSMIWDDEQNDLPGPLGTAT